jgi:protease I
MDLRGKKILFVVAGENFRDEECFEPKKILEEAGAEVKIASNVMGEAAGSRGGRIRVDLSVLEARAEDFDAIVFVGGSGALEDLDNPCSYELARKAASAGKIVAAICVSPLILAKAGILKDKKATVWSSPEDRGLIEQLRSNGAEYVDQNVVKDGKVITANGPRAAVEFGREILNSLSQNR